MIQHGAKRKVETDGEFTTSAFRIKASAKAFKILSDSLYNNKFRAVVRELSCNAVDAHRAAGTTDVPFELKVPNSVDPEFRIRDYGTGLSRPDLETIYTTYFESTKEDTNDDIGGLGLGSKSPFSYTDSMVVTSFHDGMRHEYVCYLDEEGIPGITYVSTEDSDEPSGLEVKFAARGDDWFSFFKETKNVMTWLDAPVKLLGSGITDDEIELAEMASGDGWRVVDASTMETYPGPIVALMGGVAYPITNDMIDMPERHEKFAERLRERYNGDRMTLVVEFDIGDLDVSASRESLSADKITVQNMNAVVVRVADEMADRLESINSMCVGPCAHEQFREIVKRDVSRTDCDVSEVKAISVAHDGANIDYPGDYFTRVLGHRTNPKSCGHVFSEGDGKFTGVWKVTPDLSERMKSSIRPWKIAEEIYVIDGRMSPTTAKALLKEHMRIRIKAGESIKHVFLIDSMDTVRKSMGGWSGCIPMSSIDKSIMPKREPTARTTAVHTRRSFDSGLYKDDWDEVLMSDLEEDGEFPSFDIRNYDYERGRWDIAWAISMLKREGIHTHYGIRPSSRKAVEKDDRFYDAIQWSRDEAARLVTDDMVRTHVLSTAIDDWFEDGALRVMDRELLDVMPTLNAIVDPVVGRYTSEDSLIVNICLASGVLTPDDLDAIDVDSVVKSLDAAVDEDLDGLGPLTRAMLLTDRRFGRTGVSNDMIREQVKIDRE